MNCFNSFNTFLNALQKDMQHWQEYNRTNSGTNDEYKTAIKERIQFGYVIEDAINVVSAYKSMHQYSFWAISEFLSEIFALNPPLMYKYKPEIIEWSYKLRPDKSIEYMYGRRWNEWNQLLNTIDTLSKRRDSKRAVISIFMPYDTSPSRTDIPCTLMYTFKIRNDKLFQTTMYRSHDVFAGLKYDVLLSSFVHQLICMGVWAKTGKEVYPGQLYFYEDSLHYYPLKDKKKYEEFIAEKTTFATSNFKASNIKFDIMYPYDTVDQLFDDLWLVMKAESSSYWNNFEVAEEKINKILNPAFADFGRMYFNRNAKFHNVDKKLRYKTTILRWKKNDTKF